MGPCILHQGCSDSSGYGLVRISGRLWKAHRWAWVQANGPIPEGIQVCHTCDVRMCISVSHLFLGTLLENMADRNTKNRQAHDVQNGRHVLFPDDVRAIRLARRNGTTLRELASGFGVSMGCITAIVYERTWRHLL